MSSNNDKDINIIFYIYLNDKQLIPAGFVGLLAPWLAKLGTAVKGKKLRNQNYTNKQSGYTQIEKSIYLLTVAEEIQVACTSICTHIGKALNSIRKQNSSFEPQPLDLKLLSKQFTCGNRSSGFALGPPVPPVGTAGCGACAGRFVAGGFVACPLAGTRAAGGISACSGIP